MNTRADAGCRIRIVGLGSSFGDDQAGWRLVESLPPRDLPYDVRAVAAADPTELLDLCQKCHTLILVDACRTDQPAGTVACWEWPDPHLQRGRRQSTHHVGLPETLQLAEQLGRLPPRVVVYGIEMESEQPGADMAPAVRRAIEGLRAVIHHGLQTGIW